MTRKVAHRCRGNSFANAASSIRSAGVYRGRGTCRRSTASWCRNTTISTASALGVGPNPNTPRTRRTIINATVRTTTPRPCRPTSPQARRVTLKWHPSRTPQRPRGCVQDTVLNAAAQVKAMIISETQDNDRVPQRPVPPGGQRPRALPHRAGRAQGPLPDRGLPRPDRQGPSPLVQPVVESARGAVLALLPVRFPVPLAEPAVRLSTQRALHGFCRQVWLRRFQGLGILLPR